MSSILIVCIESPLNKSDHIYIDTILKNFFCIDTNIKLQFLSLNGKRNYNSRKIKNKIKALEKQTACRQSQVIYCLDTDKFNADVETKNLNEEIKIYCKQMEYELVWSCLTIEHAIWGHGVPSSDKTKMAQKFASNYNAHLNTERLMKSKIVPNTSNLLFIFNKYLKKR